MTTGNRATSLLTGLEMKFWYMTLDRKLITIQLITMRCVQ